MRAASTCEISVWKARKKCSPCSPRRGEEVDARDALRARGRESVTRISSPRRRREVVAMTPSRLWATMRTASTCEISVWKGRGGSARPAAERKVMLIAQDALRVCGRDSDLISPTS